MAHKSSDGNVFLFVEEVGGETGDPFSIKNLNGTMLEEITVWVETNNAVRGIRVKFGNVISRIFGRDQGDKYHFEFLGKDVIKTLSLWDNKKTGTSKRLGGIEFTTTEGNVFSAKMIDTAIGQETKITVGSGVCTGITGNSGIDVDKLGFVFLKELDSCILNEVTYTDLNKNPVKVKQLNTEDYQNDGNVSKNEIIHVKNAYTEEHHWPSTIRMVQLVDKSVSAPVPKIIWDKNSFKWTLTENQDLQESNSTLIDEDYDFKFLMPETSKITASVLVGEAKDAKIDYSGTIVMKTKDGSTFSFPTSDQYVGTLRSIVRIALDYEKQ